MFKGTSLKVKLLILCGFLSLVSVIIGMISYSGSVRVANNYDRVADDSLPNLNNLNEMFIHYQTIRISLRTLGLPNLSKTTADTALTNLQQAIEGYLEADKAYQSNISLSEQTRLYEKLQKEWTHFSAIGERVVKAFHSTDPAQKAELETIFFKECPESAAKYDAALDELKSYEMKSSTESVTLAKEVSSETNVFIFILAISGLVVGMIVGILFSNLITKTMTTIAEDILTSSKHTSQASRELTSASSQLSEGATQSAASLEETVSSLEELSSMVKLNSDHAREANKLSQSSLDSAVEGEGEMKKLTSAMGNMMKSSKKIEEIITVIDDIAFQTNLLALNAAVEAARAGEQGKGFAVVADAVRSLAQRSAVAAKDINELIEENVRMNENGVKIANSSGEALSTIVTSVKKVAELNSEISAASQEQANGIEQISKAMNHLDSAIQKNASSSEEVAASAEEMSSQSVQLVQYVGNLKEFVEGGKGKDIELNLSLRPELT